MTVEHRLVFSIEQACSLWLFFSCLMLTRPNSTSPSHHAEELRALAFSYSQRALVRVQYMCWFHFLHIKDVLSMYCTQINVRRKKHECHHICITLYPSVPCVIHGHMSTPPPPSVSQLPRVLVTC